MMNKASEFNNILDECLERVIKGESIEQCLAEYTEYAAELEPLLQTALDAIEATAIKPRPEFRERASYQFQTAIRDMETESSRGFFGWFPRWATVVAVIVVILLAGSGTVAAAGNSLPDEPLYQVKIATEAVRLAFTPSDLGKAELYAKLADKRVDEIINMADKGKVAQVERATERLNDQLIAMANLAAPEGKEIIKKEAVALEPEQPRMMTVEKAPAPAPEPSPAPAAAPRAQLGKEPPTEVETVPPAPVIEVPPAPVEEAPVMAVPKARGLGEDAGKAGAVKEVDEGVEIDNQAKLRAIISRKALENSRALQDVLERVPESVKPALLRALEIADNGYEQAIRNLE